MENNERFKQHLENKYGSEITNLIYKKGRLIVENIKEKNDYNQQLVINHLNEIDKNNSFKIECIDNKKVRDWSWAFDFSGWTGVLDFSKKTLKEYMVIGLEPHIERYDFQVTYGLSDKTPESEKRFSISEDKKRILCKDDSDTIWTNVFKLIASDEIKRKVFEENDIKSLDQFLENFYITDLCHFAPQGNAKLIKNIKNWSKIREVTAKKFLKEEINIINPKIIITQGTYVFDLLIKILEIDEHITYTLEKGKIRVAKKDEIKIIGLPHIGSNLIQKTFWFNNIEKVRKKLIEKEILQTNIT